MYVPAYVTNLFLAVVGLVVALFVFATWRAGFYTKESPGTRAVWTATGVLVLGVVMAGAIGLASSGVLQHFDTLPPPAMGLVVIVTVLTLVLAIGPFGGRLAGALPLSGLVGFQGFRVLVEIVLFLLHREGVVPLQMTFEGMNFDAVSGIAAVVLGTMLLRGDVSRKVVLAWNVTGLLLLITIVVISALSLPTPLRAFHTEPPSVFITEVPFVLLPTFLVQAALFGHVLVFRRLRRDAQRRTVSG